MKIAPPTHAQIESTVSTAERSVRRTIGRRRNMARVGIGAGAVVVIGIAGTGAATAFFPQYYDLEGVVKTVYAEDFVDCIQAAGWDAQILSPTEGAPTIESWGFDTSTHTVVSSHLLQDTQGEAGRAISLCQEDMSADVGEPIIGTSN
jgi:hypothetical protein